MKVAVVGSGCAGLAATWALNEHSEHEVHLFEAADRPGGHANTVRFTRPDDPSKSVDVDTYIVLNPPTYPNFLRFLRLLNIPVIDTEMTFSVSRDQGAFEWAGKNLLTVFCQAKNLLDPAMWRLIWDVLRFNASAVTLLKEQEVENPNLSIGEYLEREGYSESFRDNYLVPMTAAVWSTPPDLCAMDFPARTLIQFMHNHHLLQLIGKPSWMTIAGGCHLYVKRILSKLPKSQLHLSTPIHSVQTQTQNGKVILTTAGPNGKKEEFDHVILACHSDTSLAILERGDVTEDERRILSSFRWNKNEAVLHCDTRLMPKRRAAWSSWNYLTASVKTPDGKLKANENKMALTYSMNILQHISEETYGPVLVTLNAPFEPQKGTLVGRYSYEHPIMDARARTAQASLPSIQSTRNISYAGAWTAYGFHEDGFTSGLLAVTSAKASKFGVKLPFEVKFPDRKKSMMGKVIFDVLGGFGMRGVILIGILVVWSFWR
ncbi:hypothetical protein M422DRAFT_25299 [Sphaerobolus stellatus SS14]|nr:hypothetical protein M422DRAFT_25299 [Sphaerobolus stellatus SS14]